MNSVKVGQVIFLAGGTVALCLLLHRLVHSLSALWSPAQCSSPIECPTSDGPQSRQTKGVRLCQVYPSPESKTATDIDIIAIHGLDTKSPDTWLWEPKGARVNWLEDSHMLPKRLPTTRIFTCDWPADLLEQPDFIQKTINEYARLLLAGIKSRPPAANETPGKDDRPIVFIASCLGGIVLMKALTMASHEYLSVKWATRGVVFLATPFRGTSFQDVAKWAEPGLRAWASIRDKKVSNLLEHVKPTFDLDELVRSFTAVCREIDLIDRVCTFYETGKSSLPRKIAPWLPASLSQEQPLVDRLSATLDIVPHPLALDRPHILMNKFSSPDDSGYIAVAERIDMVLRIIRENRPIAQADDWIRNGCYSWKNLAINRLSGDLLPMDRCYINLAIVEQSRENNSHSEEMDTAQHSSPFSLRTRLKVETPDEDIQATLPNLFESRQTRDNQMRVPSRILIRGRAGVGKTTLCKKIVYEFMHGTMWRNLFNRVLWVPLRNLKRIDRRQISAQYNLGNLFRHEYFSQHPEGDRLAGALWDVVKDSKTARTLFILDGLDEVLQDLNDGMYDFLKELLNQANVIITSRPNATLPAWLDAFHLEVETIGFYPAQVAAYIENAFTDRETRKHESEKISQVQSFLQQHLLLQGLVRIPIQLDALCLIWDEDFKANPIPETMTAVYKGIVQRLWKKDIVRLGKKTENEVKRSLPSETEEEIEIESKILELLAYSGLYRDVIEFQPAYRDSIRKRFKPGFSLDKMFGDLSFLRASDPSIDISQRSYHFLHLTFQEFFAARYFIRKWRDGENLEYLVFTDWETSELLEIEPLTFLQQHKYDARYDIFWRFVTGLLGVKQVSDFFYAIEQEPLDLLGPAHQRLVMHCLSEVDSLAKLPNRTKLEAKLAQWILFEFESMGSSFLAGESECPDSVVHTALKSERGRVGMLDALRSSRAHLSTTTIETLVALLKDRDKDVQSNALNALKRQSQLPQEAFTALVTLLKDNSSSVRKMGAAALKSQSQLPQEAVTALVVLLKDKDKDVQLSALEALKSQSHLPQEAVTALVALLKDKNKDVQSSALEALKSQSQLPGEAVTALVALIKNRDTNSSVRSSATGALGNQLQLPQEAVTALVALLKDEESSVRLITASALGHQSRLPREAVTAFIALLKDEESSVRLSTALALGHQSRLPREAVTAFVALLKDEDSSIRSRAAAALGRQLQLPQEAVAALIALIKDGDEDRSIRVSTAFALGSQSQWSGEAITALVALLKDKDIYVLSDALEKLGRLSQLPPQVVTALMALIKDEDEDSSVRVCTAMELGSSRVQFPEEAMTALVTLLQDNDTNIQVNAIFALQSQLQLPQEAVTALIALLKDEDVPVRWSALDTLGKQKQSQLPKEVVTDLVALIKNRDETSLVQSSAAGVLGIQLQLPQEVVTALIALFKDKDSSVREMGAAALEGQSQLPQEAVTAFVALFKDKDEKVQSSALNALRRQLQLPQEVVTALIALLKDKDSSVRKMGAAALKSQSQLPQEAVTALTALLKDEDVQWRALDALGSQSKLPGEAATALVMLLKDNSSFVQSSAADALENQSQLPQEAVTALVALLMDKDSSVRPNAVKAISRLSRLSDMTFEAIGLSESEKSTQPTICNIQFVEALYEIWLRRSFEEQLSLYISKGREACIVNQPNGLRTALFDDQSQYEQFFDALNKGRQLWADRWRQDLWGDYV